MITEYKGEAKLIHDENYALFRWDESSILFSVTQQGRGLKCHIESGRQDLRKLGEAIEEFIQYLEKKYPWAKMIIATPEKLSIQRLLNRLGFATLSKTGEGALCVRRINHGRI